MEERLNEFAVDLLTDDVGGVGRRKLVEELVLMESGLKRKMDAGLTPDEANKCETLRAAVDAARSIVDAVWESDHN